MTHVSEFEAMILHYKDLEAKIIREKEHSDVGPITQYTGKLG